MNIQELVQKVTDLTSRIDTLSSMQSMLELAYARATRPVSANIVTVSGEVESTPGATKTHGQARVGVVETPLHHYLGRTPSFVGISPRANATVWQSREADADFIYLQASASVDVNWTAEV